MDIALTHCISIFIFVVVELASAASQLDRVSSPAYLPTRGVAVGLGCGAVPVAAIIWQSAAARFGSGSAPVSLWGVRNSAAWWSRAVWSGCGAVVCRTCVAVQWNVDVKRGRGRIRIGTPACVVGGELHPHRSYILLVLDSRSIPRTFRALECRGPDPGQSDTSCGRWRAGPDWYARDEALWYWYGLPTSTFDIIYRERTDGPAMSASGEYPGTVQRLFTGLWWVAGTRHKLNFLTRQYFDAKWAGLAIGTMDKGEKIDSLFDGQPFTFLVVFSST